MSPIWGRDYKDFSGMRPSKQAAPWLYREGEEGDDTRQRREYREWLSRADLNMKGINLQLKNMQYLPMEGDRICILRLCDTTLDKVVVWKILEVYIARCEVWFYGQSSNQYVLKRWFPSDSTTHTYILLRPKRTEA